MKPSAVLINTARGGIVDEPALCAALDSGRLRAAALDCFEQEPLPPDSPLRTTPNLILTPHSIGHTVEGARAVAARFEDNILRSLRGDLPCNLRNPEVLDGSLREQTIS
jgi:phosphoglycerate dehydrogenase-like enzyme